MTVRWFDSITVHGTVFSAEKGVKLKVQVLYQKLNTDTGNYEDVKAFDEVRSIKVEQQHDVVHNVMKVIIRDTQEYV